MVFSASGRMPDVEKLLVPVIPDKPVDEDRWNRKYNLYVRIQKNWPEPLCKDSFS